MKLYYYITIPVFFLIIFLLALLLFSYKPPVVSKKLTEEINELTQNMKNIVAQQGDEHGNNVEGGSMSLYSVSSIWEKNLFDPARGSSKTLLGDSNLSEHYLNFELLGIFSYGEDKGAIIIPKVSGDYSVNSNYSTYMDKNSKPRGNKIKFKVGESVDSTYVLDSIGNGFVILNASGQKIKLPMKYGSEDSAKRNVAIVKDNAQQQVNIIKKLKGKNEESGN